jgi:hypothetical protein
MKKLFFLLFCLYPAFAFADNVSIEGRVLTEKGPLKGAVVSVYESYADITEKTPFFTSAPTDEQGLYKFQLPAGEYYYIARGERDDRAYFSYHGNNPIKIENEKIWLTFMANEVKETDYSQGATSLKGRVTYKGMPVKGAYITLYTPETKKFKGLGYRTESVAPDGTFDISLPPGKYIVIARKKEDGRRMRPLEKGDLFCYYPQNPVEVQTDKVVQVEVPCYPKGERDIFTEVPRIKSNDYTTVQQLDAGAQPGIKGTVRDIEGNPVSGLYVLAYRSKQSVFLMHHLSTRTEYIGETDEKGNYFIPVDNDGDFYIVARDAIGRSPQSGDIFGMYEGKTTRQVSFKEGQLIDNVDIVVGRIKDIQQLSVSSQGSAVEEQDFKDFTTIEENTTWKGTVLIHDVVLIKRGVTLTIEPGTMIRFFRNDSDSDGIGDGGIVVEGNIIARGTKEERIVFTSASERPERKDWSYIMVLTAEADSIFEYCEVHYAFTGIQIQYSNAKISDCLFNNNHEGLRFRGANLKAEFNDFKNNTVGIGFAGLDGTIHIINSNISKNNVGILFMHPRANPVDVKKSPEPDGTLLIENNNIYDNIEYNFKIEEGQSMDIHVTGNWWGSTKRDIIEASLCDKRIHDTLGRIFYAPYAMEPLQHIGIR